MIEKIERNEKKCKNLAQNNSFEQLSLRYLQKSKTLMWRLKTHKKKVYFIKFKVFSMKKTLNSQGNLKKILFKVLTIGFYTVCPSFRLIMHTIPKKLFLFQGKPFGEPFFDFFKISEALLCEWVSHRCEKVIVGRGEVWRVRRVR